ncbi:unnamed protein product [Clonostachys rosea]|uniref:Uncharacterized protein n=1 Tax=Bionectria ochroleuca TaxID=29856 RepID=A0ABY6UAV9_BIOOC|nr:unnamed protein product [Clonostachys rosea]
MAIRWDERGRQVTGEPISLALGTAGAMNWLVACGAIDPTPSFKAQMAIRGTGWLRDKCDKWTDVQGGSFMDCGGQKGVDRGEIKFVRERQAAVIAGGSEEESGIKRSQQWHRQLTDPTLMPEYEG